MEAVRPNQTGMGSGFGSMVFPVSNVEVAFWIPPLVAFGISCFTSMGGLSGAFLLLPFQMSVLGFQSPSVTPTNHLYNVVSIPSGVYRYVREGRMAWPLAWVIIAGTLPGVFVGSWLRIYLLPDPRNFKVFVGCVLLYVGGRMVYETLFQRPGRSDPTKELEKEFHLHSRKRTTSRVAGDRVSATSQVLTRVKALRFSPRRAEYSFYGEVFSFSPLGLFSLTSIVGIIGGTYGIGGGAIIVPFLVTFYRLPIYTIAGAALLGTFVTSFAAVLFFTFFAHTAGPIGTSITPDWSLGVLFGLGGFLGMYTGARMQRFMPATPLKILLGLLVTFLALRYMGHALF